MKIGEAAQKIGLSVKQIRHYHDIGLVPALKGENGYRQYGEKQLQNLQFVARCRALNFSLEQSSELLGLLQSSDRTAGDVKQKTEVQLISIRKQIKELQQLEHKLGALVQQCQGGNQNECPILDALNGDIEPATQQINLTK